MKCAHQPCTCEAALELEGKKYCSDACAGASSTSLSAPAHCTCGHPECGKTKHPPPH